MNQTTQEQMTAWEAKRAAAAGAIAAIRDETNKEGATLNAEQDEKFQGLKSEICAIDKHLAFLRETENMIVVRAAPVTPTAGTEAPEAKERINAGDLVLRNNTNLPKGIGLARYVKAFAHAKGNYHAAFEYAQQWNTSTPEVALALKTAVSAGTTTDSAWAGPLVYNQNLASEFVEYLRPMTIIGKLQGLRRVPFNVRYPIQLTGSSVAWVGQGAAKPVSALSFTSGSLGFAKAAGIVVITMELARFSSPAAETVVRDDLAAQMVYFLDQQFIDPAVAAVANVSPASILNGASNHVTSHGAWTTRAAVITDTSELINNFVTHEINLSGAYWVMPPSIAMAAGFLQTPGGENAAFPGIGVNGGTFLGFPVIVSSTVPHATTAGSVVALIVPSEVFLADDGGIAIDTSSEASLEMSDAPTNNSATPTATSLVSMFQTNSIAIRAERIINWARRRNYGVGYISGVKPA